MYFFLFLLSPLLAHADDNPSVDEGSSEYSQEMCVSENTDACIDAVCMTSTAVDCQDQCQTDAEDKCQQQADQ